MMNERMKVSTKFELFSSPELLQCDLLLNAEPVAVPPPLLPTTFNIEISIRASAVVKITR